MSRRVDDEHAREVHGTRAGFVTRVVAGAIDVVFVFVLYVVTLFMVGIVRFLVTREDLHLPRPDPWVTGVLFSGLLIAALTIAWSASGRTVGDGAVGLRVIGVRRPIGWPLALGRAIIVVATSGLTLLTVPFSKRNDALHDMVCGTAVVYDWRPRRARVTRSTAERDREQDAGERAALRDDRPVAGARALGLPGDTPTA